MRVKSKKELELALSRIEPYRGSKKRLEQYQTPVSLVAHMAWTAYMRGDVEGLTIADLGCGDGRISIAALLLGASRAVCIDVDEDILLHGAWKIYPLFPEAAGRLIHVNADVARLGLVRVDTVLMNPPFGVVEGNRGVDILFLRVAMGIARVVYSIHKYSEGFFNLLREVSESKGFELASYEIRDFEIPMMFETHRRRIYRFKTVFVVLVESGGS
ncbi:METTL5 family protein [Desulfurococcus mucosus]|uniref:Methyltransferase n=1 Tax=Desulfurococcus mucosus (strain ATCC 35584 / DSM 2162 / JCM 9187 / O7/1) TaxID=765177 RepID=E8RAE7_DESM0|nr:METTL5 family protein [Desulfurococcus mucosus]ADV64357.1 methyltransferase [Desulfurococcus mucosus DSM 2162]